MRLEFGPRDDLILGTGQAACAIEIDCQGVQASTRFVTDITCLDALAKSILDRPRPIETTDAITPADLSANTDRRLRRIFQAVHRKSAATSPEGVLGLFGVLVDLVRERNLPDTNAILAIAREVGVPEHDLPRLAGIVLAAKHGHTDLGRLRTYAPPSAELVALTRAEAFAVRQVLFLLLYGPFCNVSSHPGGGSKSDTHTLTGLRTGELKLMMKLLDEALRSTPEVSDG